MRTVQIIAWVKVEADHDKSDEDVRQDLHDLIEKIHTRHVDYGAKVVDVVGVTTVIGPTIYVDGTEP